MENERLEEKVRGESGKVGRWEEERGELVRGNEVLRAEVERLEKEVAFLTDKVGFYEA